MKTLIQAFLAGLAGLATVGVLFGATGGDAVRGQYIFRVAESCGCHGPNQAGYREGGPSLLPAAAPFGERFDGPFGLVPSSNLTSDAETGLGNWDDGDLARVLRTGTSLDGRRLAIMPHFSGMAEEDLRDLIAYLRGLPAVKNKVPNREFEAPANELGPPPEAETAPRVAPVGPPEKRGEYLVREVATCWHCHTTTNAGGKPLAGHFLAGNAIHLAEDEWILPPNITPDRETGIGSWSAEDVKDYLKSAVGMDPTQASGLKEAILASSFQFLTDEDALAIGIYLKTVAPVKHIPRLPPAVTPPGAPGDR